MLDHALDAHDAVGVLPRVDTVTSPAALGAGKHDQGRKRATSKK